MIFETKFKGLYFYRKFILIFLCTFLSLKLLAGKLPLFLAYFPQPKTTEEVVTNLQPFAKAITIKINLEEGFGSGVIIGRRGSLYTVITNAHVIRGEKSSYSIQTFDGECYWGKVLEFQGNNSPDFDIAILQFYSPKIVYSISKNGKLPQENDFILAVGFASIESSENKINNQIQENKTNNQIQQKKKDSINENLSEYPQKEVKFHSTIGKVTFVLNKPLLQGYQLGYTNPVTDGMSGGAILNEKGELVGINGLRAYPILGDPYIYQDHSTPSESMQKLMEKSSWGISINTITKFYSQISYE